VPRSIIALRPDHVHALAIDERHAGGAQCGQGGARLGRNSGFSASTSPTRLPEMNHRARLLSGSSGPSSGAEDGTREHDGEHEVAGAHVVLHVAEHDGGDEAASPIKPQSCRSTVSSSSRAAPASSQNSDRGHAHTVERTARLQGELAERLTARGGS